MQRFWGMIVTAGLLGWGANAGATKVGNPVDLEVWAQMNGTLQISVVSATSYDFGAVTASSVNVSTTTFDIQNTGGGLTQTYQIKGNNSANWTLAAAPALNAFSLDVQFNGPAAPSTWTASHRLTTAYQSSDGTVFAGNQTGLSVPTGAVRSLWTRLAAPTGSSSAARQRIQLDINAVTP
jgi:hypothetical protein